MKKFLWISTLVLLPSALGRSPFISALKPFLKEHLYLPEASFSLAYTLGTLFASFCLPWVICCFGKSFQLRKCFQWTYFISSISLLGILWIANTALNVWVSFFLLVGSYLGLRLCGQGLLPALTRTYTASICQDHQCAWVGTLHTTSVVCFGGGFLFVLSKLNLFAYWSSILFFLTIVFAFLIFLMPKDLPEIQSLSAKSFRKFGLVLKNFPGLFKVGVLIIALHNLQATALAFHLSDFASEQKISLAIIFQFFLPIGILELLLNPLIAWLYGHCRSKFLLMGSIANIILLNAASGCLSSPLGQITFIATCALGWSFNHILSYSLPAGVLPKEQHAIGYAALGSYASLFSAIGPFAYSCLAVWLGSYTAVNTVMLVANACCLVVSLLILRKNF